MNPCRAATALMVALAAACAGSGSVTVEQAYGFAPPDGSEMALYFTLRNEGTAEDTLIEVRTAMSAITAIHGSRAAASMMQMERLDRIPLAPGEVVTLEPGGAHVMMTQLRRPPTPGDTVHVALRFARAGERVIAVPVIAYGDQPPPEP